MKLMAIDPGLKGGIAVFDDEKLVAIDPMLSSKMQYGGRGKKHCLISLSWLRQVIDQHDIEAVVLEVPSAMPRQSSVATATTFTNWGLLLALASSVKLLFVYPQMWKKHYGLNRDKVSAIKQAHELLGLPLATTDGEAEAALIGHYWLHGGSERERAYAEKQRTRPKRRKRKAARQPAPALRKRRPRPAPPAPPAASSSPART